MEPDGVFQARDFIEVVVVDPVMDGLEGCLEVGVVHDPSRVVSDGALDGDLDAPAVPVETGAFVARGYVGEAVSGFDLKGFSEFHKTGAKGGGQVSRSVQVTKSPKAGRPSCRQAAGGSCIRPMGQMRLTPQWAS